jgi:hypothetical protein
MIKLKDKKTVYVYTKLCTPPTFIRNNFQIGQYDYIDFHILLLCFTQSLYYKLI